MMLSDTPKSGCTSSKPSHTSSLSMMNKTLIAQKKSWKLLASRSLRWSMADDGSTLAVSVHLACLILVLLCKLDMKADIYKDVSLSYLFLANNLHFIVENVQQTPNLKLLLGEDWVTEHANKVKLYASNYESTTRTKVLSSSPEKSSEISPEMAKECFKRFNARLKKQTSWSVEDGNLRELLEGVNCTVYNLYDSFIFCSVPSDRFRSSRKFSVQAK